MKNLFFYETDWGRLYIADNGDYITDVGINKTVDQSNFVLCETELIKKTWNEITDYFEGKRKTFDVPLELEGTEFQKKVWNCLCNIPYGKTKSYKDIAKECGNSSACRAVGMANNKNPVFIIVPCHRVIGFDGNLVGYGGGLELKKRLLDLEKNNS